MRPMVKRITAILAVGLGLVSGIFGAAPVVPSYLGVERTIDGIRRSWSSPGAPAQPNAPGWNALFDALLAQLGSYSHAESDSERLEAMNRIDQISAALSTVPWAPAANLHQEIQQWLQPRVRLAGARQRLSETVQAMPATADPNILANRSRWVNFIQDDLGHALRDYDAAATVSQRQSALHRIHESLDLLRRGNQSRAWGPSWELQSAVGDLFNRRNLDISADVNTVAPVFNANLVESGPVTRKGYVSQVTAGPKTGFGLLSSDDGIAFFNSQLLTSVTPIWDFHNQIASDPQGQRAAKLYHFDTTTYDWSELTITTVLRDSGLQITPSYRHNIDATISSQPVCGGEFGRLIAGLIGMNQQTINDRVYQGAIGKFRERIPAEAMEEATERIAGETERRNADLRSKGLIGNNTVEIKDFRIKELLLRSRPEGVFVGGLFQWQGAPELGADAPQPARLNTFETGVTANVHLSSLLTSLIRGAFQRDPIKSVQNLTIVTKDVPAGTPPREAFTLIQNTDLPAFLRLVDEAQKAKNPKVTALRLTRPQEPPEFNVDARGFLVALIHDFQLDVPAPAGESKGGLVGAAAKIYRIKVPLLELALSYQVDTPPKALHVRAKVEDFSPGTPAEVLAITDDETKAIALSRFSAALVLGAIGGRLRTQPIEFTLDQSALPGFSIHSVSPLDPSGWLRVTLDRNANSPAPKF
jgi:hypothetical protein